MLLCYNKTYTLEEDVMSKPVEKNSSNTSKRPAPKGPANSARKPLPNTAKKPLPKAATKAIDLSQLFGSVAKTMIQNKTSLNAADTYNHDHGDNMVQIFEVITQAMKEKANASPADQLAYASQILRAKSQSGSAQLYAEGLSDAASQFQGAKSITPDTAMTLIQTLLGAKGSVPVDNTQSGGAGDLLGSLLGGLTGAGSQTTDAQGGGAGDLLGSLLGGLTGAQQPEAAAAQGGKGQIDIGSLLNAGMAFAQSKQAGGSNLDAILNAVVSSSKMSDSSHRSQSGALVANTLMQVVGQLAAKK
jgi:phosphoenolpyruvate---glycerone phosphotransferase subunit DhaL